MSTTSENGNKTDNYLDIKPDGTYEYHKDGTTYDGTYKINKNPDGTIDITFNGEGGLIAVLSKMAS